MGRNLQDLTHIVNDLEARGVKFRSLKESVDAGNSSGKLVFHLFVSLQHFTLGGKSAAEKFVEDRRKLGRGEDHLKPDTRCGIRSAGSTFRIAASVRRGAWPHSGPGILSPVLGGHRRAIRGERHSHGDRLSTVRRRYQFPAPATRPPWRRHQAARRETSCAAGRRHSAPRAGACPTRTRLRRSA
ncbi:recombinase family protein [Burkholderia pyrrocinia]